MNVTKSVTAKAALVGIGTYALLNISTFAQQIDCCAAVWNWYGGYYTDCMPTTGTDPTVCSGDYGAAYTYGDVCEHGWPEGTYEGFADCDKQLKNMGTEWQCDHDPVTGNCRKINEHAVTGS